MRPMTRLFVAMVVCVFAVGMVSAQDAIKPQTGMGSKALLFTFQGFNVDQFNYGVGLKFYLAPSTALRASVGVGYSTTTQKSASAGYTDSKSDSLSLPISAGIEFHVMTTKAVTLYLGADAGVVTGSGTYDPSYPVGGTGHKSTSSFTMLQASGILGAEYFVSQSVSFAAEYHLGFATRTGTYEYTSGGQTLKSDMPTYTQIGTSAGMLILAIYF